MRRETEDNILILKLVCRLYQNTLYIKSIKILKKLAKPLSIRRQCWNTKHQIDTGSFMYNTDFFMKSLAKLTSFLKSLFFQVYQSSETSKASADNVGQNINTSVSVNNYII